MVELSYSAENNCIYIGHRDSGGHYIDIGQVGASAWTKGVAAQGATLAEALQALAAKLPPSGQQAPTTAPSPAASGANARQVGGTHYRATIQHWDWVIANGLGYLEGQITKYIARWRKKNGIEDLEKAKHYLDKLIEVAKSEKAP